MKRILLFTTIFFISVIGAFAQSYDDVVYLTNGSVIHGVITEIVVNETLKIQTRDGNIFVFNLTDVQKITKESKEAQNAEDETVEEKTHKRTNFNKPRGIFGLLEVKFPTVFCGAGEFGVDYIAGYRVCPQFAAGVGVGMGTFLFKNYQTQFFVHLRSDILNKRVSPYVAFNMGYNYDAFGIDLTTYNNTVYNLSGMLLTPQVGVSFNVDKFRMTAGFSFNFQQCSQKVYSSEYEHTTTHTWDCELLGITVGFSF